MTIPQRVQRRRTKGWRMPDNTIYVDAAQSGETHTPSKSCRKR